MTTLPQRLEELINVDPEFVSNWSADYDRGANDHKTEQRDRSDTLSHSVLQDMQHAIFDELRHEEDCPYYKGKLCICILADVRAALTAYCIGEGEKSDNPL